MSPYPLTAVTTNMEAQLNFDQIAEILGDGNPGQVLTADDNGDAAWGDIPSQTFAPARAYRTAALTLPNGFGSLGADTVSYDPGANLTLSGGAYRFIAPATGYYQISGQARVTTIAASNLAITIYVAARGVVAEGDVNLSVPTGTGVWGGTVVDIVSLSQGDLVDIQLFSSPANNTLYVANGTLDNHMTVVQVA